MNNNSPSPIASELFMILSLLHVPINILQAKQSDVAVHELLKDPMFLYNFKASTGGKNESYHEK